MTKEMTTQVLETAKRLAVNTRECYVVVSLQEPNICAGPFGDLESAQRKALELLMQRTQWNTVSVFQIVGTVTKPMPDLQWTTPPDDQ
jgi:hypothetical protein